MSYMRVARASIREKRNKTGMQESLPTYYVVYYAES